MKFVKKLILSLAAGALAFSATAQVQFQTTIDLGASEQASDIKQTSDGGYIVAGLQYATGSQTAFLLKLDQFGNVQWNKTYSGGYTSGSNLFTSYRVIQLNEGGYLLVGSTQSFGFTNAQIYVIKTDAFGDTLWTRTYGSSAGNDGNSIFEAEDGTYVIGGSFSFSGQRRMGVLRIKSDGSIRSESYYADGVACPFFECVKLADNRFGIIYTYSSMLVIVDSVGTLLSSIPLGFGSGFSVGAFEEPNGEFVTLNQISGLIGNAFGLVRTDFLGNTSLSKKYATSNDDTPREIIRAFSGNYILFGLSTSMNGPSFLQAMEVDTAGNVIWSNRYNYASGAYHEAANIVATADGGYVMVGQHDRSGQFSDFDVYVVKTDALGQSGCNQSAYTPNVAAASPFPPPAVTPFTASLTNTGTSVPAIVSTITTVTPTVLCLSVGVDEHTEAVVADIYPNPVKDILHIRSKNPGLFDVTFFDVTGKTVHSSKITKEAVIDVSAFPTGIYLLQWREENGQTGRRRIQIVH